MGRTLLLLLLCLVANTFAGEAISALYLSWYGDPTSTMTIQWHTPSDDTSDAIQLRGPDGKSQTFTGTHAPFPEEPLLIHTLSLQNLLPDTEYHFQIDDNSEVYTFRTAPKDLTTPLRFIIGGDLYLSPKLFRKMSQTAVEQDPLFAVLGGDIAYAIGNPAPFFTKPARQWRHFLAEWTELLRTPSNRLIPFLIVPGNHDIATDRYELFFALFAFPSQQLYRAVDFGNYLTLLLLDTGHFHPIEGQQTHWLAKTLAARTPAYLFSVYHEGAYPSVYSYNGSIPSTIRANWCPLFDKHHVQAAFEHHSHSFKKTYPLKASQKDPSGTIYFGDGCWGAPPRATRDYWYLEKKGRKNNIYLIEMDRKSASVKAIGLTGDILDQSENNP